MLIFHAYRLHTPGAGKARRTNGAKALGKPAQGLVSREKFHFPDKRFGVSPADALAGHILFEGGEYFFRFPLLNFPLQARSRRSWDISESCGCCG